MSTTIPSKTYSASYPRYYGEYGWQQQNCSWQNDHFFSCQQYLKKKAHCVLGWKILTKIDKTTICIRIQTYIYIYIYIYIHIYIYLYVIAIMKIMCPPGYHHNGFVATFWQLYTHLGSVKFGHCVSWVTYDHLYIYNIYIFKYIYL